MAAAIQAIMPTSKSCADAKFPDECRTAEQAAPFISKACADLSTGECAATVALMGLESVEMKFKHNVSPGRPGQGTANMMMADVGLAPTPGKSYECIFADDTPRQFTLQYATDLFGADQVNGKSPDNVLAMVTVDEHNFGSAAWFLKTECTADVRTALETGTNDGWIAYNKCIGVDGSLEERMAYWTRAQEAFGLKKA
jgi:hypothetical protein